MPKCPLYGVLSFDGGLHLYWMLCFATRSLVLIGRYNKGCPLYVCLLWWSFLLKWRLLVSQLAYGNRPMHARIELFPIYVDAFIHWHINFLCYCLMWMPSEPACIFNTGGHMLVFKLLKGLLILDFLSGSFLLKWRLLDFQLVYEK